MIQPPSIDSDAPATEKHKPESKKPRGFAAMASKLHKEIARRGGVAAHEKGKAHEFTPDEAREAGRKGGAVVSADRAHMAEIGRKGAKSRKKEVSEE